MSDSHTARTPLKHVVIGVGAGVLDMHKPALALETVKLVGVTDLNAEVGQERADSLGCPFYPDHRSLLRETQPDIAVILTPHPFHAPIAIEALEAGAHVLVEKPIAVHAAEADAMVAAAERSGRLLAVSLQHRHRADVRTARKLIQEGKLGRMQHIDMSVAWPRTNRYYQLGAWRGTWAGEGGGVLMNQAPHNLDLIVYLLGMPSRVVAWTPTIMHAIETEDTVQAMMAWEDGTLGSIHISTAEGGRPERLELIGTGGTLSVLRGGDLRYSRFEPDFSRFALESNEPFGAPTQQPETVTLEAGSGDHVSVYRNLHDAILNGAPLVADGADGRMSLELANAMILSHYTRREVTLPLDRQAYVALLGDLINKRTVEG